MPMSMLRLPAWVAVAGVAAALLTPVASAAGPQRARRPAPARKPKPSHRHIARPALATNTTPSVNGSAATVTGFINPNGYATTYWIQYGTSPGYGRRTPTRVAGFRRGRRPISVAVGDLTPLTTYHFRIAASHCGGCRSGTVYGKDRTFTTFGYDNSGLVTAESPDPFVLDLGSAHRDYWAFTTGNLFPILRSSDLVHWQSVGTAMSTRPSWVVQSGDWHPWAPNVTQLSGSCPGTSSATCFAMYYVGLSAQFRANCVAVATAATPAGPYVDQGPLSNGTLDAAGRPIGCGDNQGYGMIDPSLFVDPNTGQRYLYGSEDFACPTGSASCTRANSTLRPTISVIPLSPDSLTASGGRTPLFAGAAMSWESIDIRVPTVEGPTMLLHNGTYYLLYSGGNWHNRYGMGYATATSPTGPFTKAATNPILGQIPPVFSPGGGDTPVVGPHGGTWIVYHGRPGSYAVPRTLRIDPFSWRPSAGSDVPVLGGPTSTAQPLEP
jgi:Glycosyl hydrolases family 43